MPVLGQNAVDRHTSVSTDSDALLLYYIAGKDECIDLATKAMEEFVRRYRSYLFTRSIQLVNGNAGAAVGWTAEDLVKAVLARVWGKAHTYKDEPDLPPIRQVRRLKAWLGSIANNLLVDQLRRCRGVQYSNKFLENACAPDTTEVQSNLPAKEAEMLREAMSTLNQREYQIITVTEQYFRSGMKQQRLPNQVSKELAEMLSTNPTNVRQIRKRAKLKIKEFMRSKGFNNLTYTGGEDCE